MASFYPMQLVRIVGCFPGSESAKFVGMQTHVLGQATNACGEILWQVAIDHGHWGFSSDQIEPVRYLPDAEDLEVQAIENAPSFDYPVPVAA